jgi:6,7-dimethyl-8-ribityllumazine synthase
MAKRKPQDQLQLPPNHRWRVGIAVADFHQEWTSQQLASAQRCLEEYGVPPVVVHVAGSFELPFACAQLANTGQFAGVVALGCLVKGETIHFEVIAESVAAALQQVAIESGVPVGFGVITAATEAEAVARLEIGYDAAYAVLKAAAAKTAIYGVHQ